MHLGEIAAKLPDKPAVVMAGSGRVVTYRELNDESSRLAQLLHAAGLRPADHIAFMLENHPLFLAIAWAAQRSGLYYTAISSRLQQEELAYIVDNCEAKVFISSKALAEVAASIAERTPRVELRLMVDGVAPGFDSYEERVAAFPAAGPELAGELIAYCRERLAHYKCPRSVDFRAELPRHPTGKLYKRLLVDEYRAASA